MDAINQEAWKAEELPPPILCISNERVEEVKDMVQEDYRGNLGAGTGGQSSKISSPDSERNKQIDSGMVPMSSLQSEGSVPIVPI